MASTYEEKMGRRNEYLSGWGDGACERSYVDGEPPQSAEYRLGLQDGADERKSIVREHDDETKTDSYRKGWKHGACSSVSRDDAERDPVYKKGAVAGEDARGRALREADKRYMR